MTGQEYLWMVEQIEDNDTAVEGPGDILTHAALAEQIKLDQESKTGEYRRFDVFRCDNCKGRKGVTPPVISTAYVGPHGKKFVTIPKRTFSDGSPGTMIELPPQGSAIVEAGFQPTQCAKCLTYFVVFPYWEQAGTEAVLRLGIVRAIEAGYGQVAGTGVRTVTYKVPKIGPLQNIH